MTTSSAPHWIARTDEEEEVALAMAIEQSLKISGPGSKYAVSSPKGTNSRPGASSTRPPAAAQPASRTPAAQSQPSRQPAPQVRPPYATNPNQPVPTRPQHTYNPTPAYPAAQQRRTGQPTTSYPPYQPQPYQQPYQPATYQQPYQQQSRPVAQPLRPQPTAQPVRPNPSTQSPARPPAVAPKASPQPSPPRQKLHTNPNNCAGCGGAFWGSYITALTRKWHPACFKCAFCCEPISLQGNSQFAVGNDDGMPYHADCHKHKYHPVCSICAVYIPAKPDGKIEYKENPFWKEKYCSSHQLDNTPQCCSCSRFQKHGQDWVKLFDGRDICLECLSTVVVDTKDAQPLYNEVLQFYRERSMTHPEKPPLMLVDGHALNEYSSREGKDRSNGPVFHVRGLTMATVYTTIPTIIRSSRGGMHVDSISTAMPKVRCSVTGILVMFGLPRLLTGCIIAHELCHAWLRMKGVTNMDQQVEEGLCQLMAYIWLEAQDPRIKDPMLKKQASYFAYQIREDPSVVYGEGFRRAHEAFQNKGLPAVMSHVIATGRLPS